MTQSKSGVIHSIFVPESEKNEAYHKSFVQSVISRNIHAGFNERRALMDECVNIYLGLQSGAEFDFIQKAEDGEVLPAKWMDFNKVAVKIDLLVGELLQRGYKINVKASNKAAQSRRLDEYDRLLTEMRFQPIAGILEEESGLPLQSDEGFIPENQDELDVYFKKKYKEKSEIVIREVLKFLRKYHNWDYERLAAFRDLLIMGCCFFKNSLEDGYPRLERRDPRYIIYDPNATDDFLSDSTYWGELCYMSLGEVIKKYKIDAKELEDAYKNYSSFSHGAANFSNYNSDFGFVDASSRLRIFKTEGGELRVLVGTAYWQDFKKITHKVKKDNYGGPDHYERVNDDSTSEKSKKTLIQIWRQGTLIGGKFMRDWGVMKNQDRSVDNIATTTPPYVALIPNYLNGAIVSKVQRLKPLQNLKNLAMYRISLEIARSGGKGFIYDVSQVPKGWDIHTAMKYLRTTGIAFVDSSVDGAGAFNQFKDIDMGLSNSVTQFLELSAALDREMDAISGVNEARQGLIQNSSQAVGVTNSALLQSNLSTHMYYSLFSQMFTKAVNKQAGLAKIAWAGKEKFSPVIGDTGVNFLEQDIELDLNDYNVFIEETPPVLADQNMFYQMIVTAMQSGQLSFLSGMKLLMEKDIDEAMNILELEMEKEKMAAQEQQEALMQQEQQSMQMQAQQSQQANAVKLQAEQMKNQTSMNQILAQARTDSKQQAMSFDQALALKKIDAAIQVQKLQDKAKQAKNKKK